MRIDSSRIGTRSLALWNLIAALQLALLTTALTIRFWNWDFDDGFIVYRYVENIVSGKGWVFNPGEFYNASTSALNTILITTIAFFGVAPTVAAHAIGACSLFVMGVSLYAVFRSVAPRWFSTSSASLCVFMMANNFTWGLESNLFYGLLSLFIALEAYGITSWLLLGTLVLVRPDAVIVVGLRVLLSLVRRTIPFHGLMVVTLAVLPWALFSLFTFGHVFPATLSQKIWQGQSGFWGTGWIFLKGLFHYVRGDALGHLSGVHWAPVVLSAPLVLVPQGLIHAIKHRSPVLLMLAFVAIGLGAYTVLNVPNYHWYYVGLLLVSFVFAGFGVLFVAEQIPLRMHPLVDRFLLLVLAVGTGFFASRAKIDFFDVRTDVYRQLAAKIVAQTPQGGRIAAVEVGVVGYYSQRPMIDIVGLTTPYGEFITGARNRILLEELKPEVIIMHAPLMPHEQAIYSDPLFVQNYRQRDLVAFPGYPELSFFVREPQVMASSRTKLSRINQNQMTEISEGVYQVAAGDPWIEYRSEALIKTTLPVLELEYQLSGTLLPAGSPVLARVYVSSGGAGYSEERAFPVLLRAGSPQTARIFLLLPGSAQNKIHEIQQVRIDPVQDMALVADTRIEVKSVSIGNLE